mmetsp:Transcript_54449/g.133481  ORF Transcript_54449/g.133481 Transcript_54449/m.133481 type:complete len:242 (+) Transcript_54449:222-947(+)
MTCTTAVEAATSTNTYGIQCVNCCRPSSDRRMDMEMPLVVITVMAPSAAHTPSATPGCSLGRHHSTSSSTPTAATSATTHTTNTGAVHSVASASTSNTRSSPGAPTSISMVPSSATPRPSQPFFLMRSLNHRAAMMLLASTDTAPSGATSAAGAKPYAMKLPASPPIMPVRPSHHSGYMKYGLLCSRSRTRRMGALSDEARRRAPCTAPSASSSASASSSSSPWPPSPAPSDANGLVGVAR